MSISYMNISTYRDRSISFPRIPTINTSLVYGNKRRGYKPVNPAYYTRHLNGFSAVRDRSLETKMNWTAFNYGPMQYQQRHGLGRYLVNAPYAFDPYGEIEQRYEVPYVPNMENMKPVNDYMMYLHAANTDMELPDELLEHVRE